MKKKLVSVLLCAAMMSTLLAGCGNGGEAAPAGDAAADTTADTAGGEFRDDGSLWRRFRISAEFQT